jgi:hypothetical protein
LAGKTVNIKTYNRQEYVLDISPHPCVYYLVLAGPPDQARVPPWVIDSVYLLEPDGLLPKLRERGVKSKDRSSYQRSESSLGLGECRRHVNTDPGVASEF